MHRLRSFLPSANYLFVFEAAARRLNFTAAAHELNVSQPAVSKTIKLLEAATGLKLFRREHARLELTAEGKRLYEAVQGSFDEMYTTISSLQRKRSKDIVRASFSASFLHLWLLPRLKGFKEKHPDVALHLQESARDDIDLVAEDVDVSARLGRGQWPGLKAWPFVKEEIWPVCSPAYLAQHGPISQASELLDRPLLHCEERYRSRVGWTEWLRSQGVDSSHVPNDLVFTDVLNSLEAAVQGQGIALGWKHLVEGHVRSGRLVPVLRSAFCPGPAVHIVMPADRSPKVGATLFRDWLLSQEADSFELAKCAAKVGDPLS